MKYSEFDFFKYTLEELREIQEMLSDTVNAKRRQLDRQIRNELSVGDRATIDHNDSRVEKEEFVVEKVNRTTAILANCTDRSKKYRVSLSLIEKVQ